MLGVFAGSGHLTGSRFHDGIVEVTMTLEPRDGEERGPAR